MFIAFTDQGISKWLTQRDHGGMPCFDSGRCSDVDHNERSYVVPGHFIPKFKLTFLFSDSSLHFFSILCDMSFSSSFFPSFLASFLSSSFFLHPPSFFPPFIPSFSSSFFPSFLPTFLLLFLIFFHSPFSSCSFTLSFLFFLSNLFLPSSLPHSLPFFLSFFLPSIQQLLVTRYVLGPFLSTQE